MVRFCTAHHAAKRGGWTEAGLADRTTGSGTPEGVPTRPTIGDAKRAQTKKPRECLGAA